MTKAIRQRHGGRLYRRHTCEKGAEARAFAKRQAADRKEAATARRQLAHERATLPENVSMLRTWRKR